MKICKDCVYYFYKKCSQKLKTDVSSCWKYNNYNRYDIYNSYIPNIKNWLRKIYILFKGIL